MRASDGKELGLGGEYREIVPNKKLVMTHVWDEDGIETVVTVTFEDLGKKTRMTFTQTGFTSDESRDGHEGGWTECFELLDDLLAELQRGRRCMTMAETKEFTFTRTFDAPRALVWKAWTSAEALGQWWGPKGAAIRVIAFDLRPGGMFHYAMAFQRPRDVRPLHLSRSRRAGAAGVREFVLGCGRRHHPRAVPAA